MKGADRYGRQSGLEKNLGFLEKVFRFLQRVSIAVSAVLAIVNLSDRLSV